MSNEVTKKCLGKNGECKKRPFKGTKYCWWHAARRIEGTKWYWNGTVLGVIVSIISLGIGYYWYQKSASSDQADQIISISSSATQHIDRVSRQVGELRENQATKDGQQQILSELRELREKLSSTALRTDSDRGSELRRKYPNGYAIFSVTETFVSEEVRNWDTNYLRANWDSAAVTEMTTNHLVFTMPEITAYGSVIKGNRIGLPRTTGVTSTPIRPMIGRNIEQLLYTNLYLTIEVLTNSPMGVTMALGTKFVVVGPNGPL